MSRAEVEAILGPPGDYTTGPFDIDDTTVRRIMEGPRAGAHSWFTDNCVLSIRFDDSNRVEWRGFLRVRKRPQASLENLRWRLSRQREKWFP
jgi:hypothetical protein